MSGREWHCFRVRPANHPRRRIVGAARLLARFLEEGLVDGLTRCASAGSPKQLVNALAVSEDGVTYVGTSRAKDIAVNVVLPFLHALSCFVDQEGRASPYLHLYHGFGKLQGNEITRETSEQLLDPTWDKVVDSARRQQGLIHLHRLLSGAAR